MSSLIQPAVRPLSIPYLLNYVLISIKIKYKNKLLYKQYWCLFRGNIFTDWCFENIFKFSFTMVKLSIKYMSNKPDSLCTKTVSSGPPTREVAAPYFETEKMFKIYLV